MVFQPEAVPLPSPFYRKEILRGQGRLYVRPPTCSGNTREGPSYLFVCGKTSAFSVQAESKTFDKLKTT